MCANQGFGQSELHLPFDQNCQLSSEQLFAGLVQFGRYVSYGLGPKQLRRTQAVAVPGSCRPFHAPLGWGRGGGRGVPMRKQRIVKHTLNSVIDILNSTPLFTVFSRSGARVTCGTSQVLLAGVSGGFSPGTPVFAPSTD